MNFLQTLFQNQTGQSPIGIDARTKFALALQNQALAGNSSKLGPLVSIAQALVAKHQLNKVAEDQKAINAQIGKIAPSVAPLLQGADSTTRNAIIQSIVKSKLQGTDLTKYGSLGKLYALRNHFNKTGNVNAAKQVDTAISNWKPGGVNVNVGEKFNSDFGKSWADYQKWKKMVRDGKTPYDPKIDKSFRSSIYKRSGEVKTPEQAGKIQGSIDALSNIQAVRKGILNPDGSVNQRTLIEMSTGFPKSKGRYLRSKIMDAIQQKLRLETGAAAPETEQKNIAKRFVPSIFDSSEQVKDKLNRLESFMKGSLQKSDPELYNRLIKNRKPLVKPGSPKEQKRIMNNIQRAPHNNPNLNPRDPASRQNIPPNPNKPPVMNQSQQNNKNDVLTNAIAKDKNNVYLPSSGMDIKKIPGGAKYKAPKSGKILTMPKNNKYRRIMPFERNTVKKGELVFDVESGKWFRGK